MPVLVPLPLAALLLPNIPTPVAREFIILAVLVRAPVTSSVFVEAGVSPMPTLVPLSYIELHTAEVPLLFTT
jgi:hypothetical protein